MTKNKRQCPVTPAEPSPLEDAVNSTSEVAGNYRKGLQAVKGEYRSKIIYSKPRSLTGSLDIDFATKDRYPRENRWDYAVEYGKKTFFVEVHPASTTEVTTVIAKLVWLRHWLKNQAPMISAIKSPVSPYNWVFTTDCHILRSSKQWKLLSQIGLLPVKQLDLDRILSTKK